MDQRIGVGLCGGHVIKREVTKPLLQTLDRLQYVAEATDRGRGAGSGIVVWRLIILCCQHGDFARHRDYSGGERSLLSKAKPLPRGTIGKG